MLPEGTIAADRIWKRFRPDRNTSLFRYELDRFRSRFGKRELDWAWALRDVSFLAQPGSATGLVGNNGSGKSTLLKILSRVMYPYAGSVQVSGRVGALIEVRAGISPELTGRENVGLYGTLLGLSRKQVTARFDEIVAFAQLESSIDRQVKFYSSGMQMRLGFAVAAYLEPAILLVDEVLAVGDAAFQQRCLERMRTVLDLGTTLVFVSHDLASVEAICNDCVWLRDGLIAGQGETRETLAQYRRYVEAAAELEPQITGDVTVRDVEIENPAGALPTSQQPLDVSMVLDSQRAVRGRLVIGITEGTADPIFALRRDGIALRHGGTEVRLSIPRLPLPRGRYFVWAHMREDEGKRPKPLYPWQPIGSFDVAGADLEKLPQAVVRRAPFHVEGTWDIDEEPRSAPRRTADHFSA